MTFSSMGYAFHVKVQCFTNLIKKAIYKFLYNILYQQSIPIFNKMQNIKMAYM